MRGGGRCFREAELGSSSPKLCSKLQCRFPEPASPVSVPALSVSCSPWGKPSPWWPTGRATVTRWRPSASSPMTAMRRSLRYGPSSLLPLPLCFLTSGTENRATSGAPRVGTEHSLSGGLLLFGGGLGTQRGAGVAASWGLCEEVGRRQRHPSEAERDEGGAPAERIQGVPVPEELGLGCPHWATSMRGGRASSRAGAKVSPSPRFISRRGPRAV